MEEFTYETGPTIQSNEYMKMVYRRCMEYIQSSYDQLIKLGASVEDARGVLPTNIHTNIIAQFNLRALSDLVRKRWTARVQSEYRSVIVAMVEEVLKVHPWADDFLIPDKVAVAKQLEDAITQWVPDQHKDIQVQLCKMIDILRKD
jgi:thymidylate synthase ThyX